MVAFIAEPMMGAVGVLVPLRTDFDNIQSVLRKNDLLFICDEVISGFGRLDSIFGKEAIGIKPDIVTTAKQISSATNRFPPPRSARRYSRHW